MKNNDNMKKPAQAEDTMSAGRLTDDQKAMLTWKFAPGDANRFGDGREVGAREEDKGCGGMFDKFIDNVDKGL